MFSISYTVLLLFYNHWTEMQNMGDLQIFYINQHFTFYNCGSQHLGLRLEDRNKVVRLQFMDKSTAFNPIK